MSKKKYDTTPPPKLGLKHSSTLTLERTQGDSELSVTWKTHSRVGEKPARRAHAWFQCSVGNRASGSVGETKKILLHDIGAQGRYDTLLLRVDPDKVTLTEKDKGAGTTMPIKPNTNGYYRIRAAYESLRLSGKRSPHNAQSSALEFTYVLSYTVSKKPLRFDCIFEDTDPRNLEPKKASGIREQADDGYPPPGSPGDLD